MHTWQPNRICIWVRQEPQNALQAHVFERLAPKLTAAGCELIPQPIAKKRVHMALHFAHGLDGEVHIMQTLAQLPKPRGLAMSIISMTPDEHIPTEGDLFWFARAQVIRKSTQNVLIVQGDARGEPCRMVWGSFAGNYVIFEPPFDDAFFERLAMRIQIHSGSTYMNQETVNHPNWMTWAQWEQSPAHREIADSGRRLGDANLLEDFIDVKGHTTENHIKATLVWLQRVSFGEGMQSRYDPALRLMGVTATGGGKVNVSADPLDGHTIPIAQIRRDGFVTATPADSPIVHNPPSVETHENGLIYHASALVNAGEIRDYDTFMRYIQDAYERQNTVDIVPEGYMPGVLHMQHFHRQPVPDFQADWAEVLYPDPRRFPSIDFPCGVREGGEMLLSALYQSEAFVSVGRLEKVLVVVLPGHGSVALTGADRAYLDEAVTQRIPMQNVVRG